MPRVNEVTLAQIKAVIKEGNDTVVVTIGKDLSKLDERVSKLEEGKTTSSSFGGIDLGQLMNMSMVMQIAGKMF